MAASHDLSFHYHANAFAFSGEFHRPIQRSIEVQAASSLPHSGGHGQAGAENFSLDKMVSFAKGYSHVSGSKAENGYHTSQATAVLENLNILDMVTADRVVARLSSDHDPAKREGHIIAVGTHFENLRVAGCPVKVEIDHDLLIKNRTHAELSKTVASFKKSGRIADESNGVIVCSLAKSVEVDCPGVEIDGHVITVPQFGKVYVAELICSYATKLISMMRLELGSPHHATLVAASPRINGTPFP